MNFTPKFINLHVNDLVWDTLTNIRGAAAAEYLVDPTCVEKYRMQVQNHREYLKRLDSVIKCLFPNYWDKPCISGFIGNLTPGDVLKTQIDDADRLDRELYELARKPTSLAIKIVPAKSHSKRARTETLVDALVTGTTVTDTPVSSSQPVV